MNVVMGINKTSKKKCKRKKNRSIVNRNLHLNRPPMEDFIVNAEEHNILKKFAGNLEQRFNVKLCMPKNKSLHSDIIFVTVLGEKCNRENVKNFLAEKMEELNRHNSNDEDDVTLITLSESESESDISVIELDLDSEDIVKSEKNLATMKSEPLDDSVINIPTSSSNLQGIYSKKQQKSNKRKKIAKSQEVSSSEASSLCEVTSTVDDMVTKKAKLSESVLIVEESAAVIPTPDFIPLISGNKSINQKNEHSNKNSCSNSKNSNEINNDDSIMIIDDPQPAAAPRRLRPIVIDGSNVAMQHGKTSHTFSVKGIKLAIDYFLNRGHTQVTAFVPNFRRSKNPNRAVRTTDADIFDDLEKRQEVVFTPSRRVNGKNISSYDDRFIVQFAASNGGVIVSNDNYRDLLDENESFREAIEQRLLMFVFVGDVFMVPDDPLGRNGPKLDDFLSFPPEDQPKKE